MADNVGLSCFVAGVGIGCFFGLATPLARCYGLGSSQLSLLSAVTRLPFAISQFSTSAFTLCFAFLQELLPWPLARP